MLRTMAIKCARTRSKQGLGAQIVILDSGTYSVCQADSTIHPDCIIVWDSRKHRTKKSK